MAGGIPNRKSWSPGWIFLLAILTAVAGRLPELRRAPAQAAAPTSSAQSGRPISDADIMAALTPRLVDYGPYFPGELGISVRAGIVTLTGAARSPRVKAQAIAQAESARGVKGVIDRIEVIPTARVSDAQLLGNVIEALRLDPGTAPLKVRVTVRQGRVTLEGDARSGPRKNLVTWVAEGVDGARSVRNEMRIAGKPAPPDSRLASEMTRRLRSDPALATSPIEVRAHSGRVELLGQVPSFPALQRAVRDAWAAGASEVGSTGLRVNPSLAESPSRPAPSYRLSDFEIWNAVDNSLHDDPRVGLGRSSPRIDVRDGVVTLSGWVDSSIAHHSALEDASLVRGVVRVDDHLAIRKEPGRTDAEIRQAIEKSLSLQAPELVGHVTPVVRQGKVALQGTVQSPYQKWLAWDAAARVAGVASLGNELRILQGRPPRRIDEIPGAIRATLQSDALLSPGHSIQVEVRGRQATLRGYVSSSADRRRACEDAARSGAAPVVNELALKIGSRLIPQQPTECG